MAELPRLFIASSAEGLPVAEAVNIKLENVARVKQWDNAFDLSSITIDTLVARAEGTDFAVFIFHKDDEATIRGESYNIVRDNVILELGLFIGALGRPNCFVLVPNSVGDKFRLPSDLSGVTVTTYDDAHEDPVDAVAASCAKIKRAMKKLEVNGGKSKSDESATELSAAQSELFMLRHEVQREKERYGGLLSCINGQFYSIAKPATESEICAWEEGAKSSYPKTPKISRHKVYYVDHDVILPPLMGANSLTVIVANGVKVFGMEQWSHNCVYFMDGFRYDN